MPRPTPILPLFILMVLPIGGAAEIVDISETSAQGPADGASPVVLFLEIGSSDEEKMTEASFLGELRLVVDDLEIRNVAPEQRDFDKAPLTDQIAWVRHEIDTTGATAAVWLTHTENPESEPTLVVHVVEVSEGRALVRLVQASTEPGSEGELAPAVRELLDGYRPRAPVAPPWSAIFEIGAQGGIAGQEGPSTWLGGTVGLSRRLIGGLALWLRIGALGGPLGASSDVDATGWAMTTTVGLTHLWDLGPVSLGPSVGLRSWWSNLSLRAGDGPEQESGEWQAQLAARLELSFPLGERLDLTVGAGVAATPHRDTYDRSSDDKMVFATPYLSWEGGVGLEIPIH